MASTPSRFSRATAPNPLSPDAADADLLGRFIQDEDHAAFELLLQRHGGMVMALLRRLGLQQADADDAFQATFLTLVRKASAIGKRDALASWLYKVAYRIALEQRERVRKRQPKENPLTGSEQAPMEKDVAAFWSLVDREVMALPEKYRVPFVLCQLQGMTIERAAEKVGCPAGTLGTRLGKAREFLRSRLARRGLAVSAGVLVALLSQQPSHASPSPAALESTLRAAVHCRNGTAATAVAANVLSLSDNAVRAFFVAKVKFIALAASVLLVLAIAAAIVAPWLLEPERRPDEPPEDWLAKWGFVIDPDGDSRFTATRATLNVKVPGTAHVLADRGRSNGPRIVREVEGDFLVQVKAFPAIPEIAAGAFEKDLFAAEEKGNVLNAAAFHGAGILVKQDDKNFVKVMQGAVDDDGSRRFLFWQTRVDGVVKHGMTLLPGNAPFPYLRVQRVGPHLFASGSPDGERWGYYSAITGEFDDVLQVGLITEHNTPDGFEATFSDYKLDRFHYGNNPQPWKGPPAPKGCIRCHDQETPVADAELQFRWPPVHLAPRKK